jgi:hypothetical protein
MDDDDYVEDHRVTSLRVACLKAKFDRIDGGVHSMGGKPDKQIKVVLPAVDAAARAEGKGGGEMRWDWSGATREYGSGSRRKWGGRISARTTTGRGRCGTRTSGITLCRGWRTSRPHWTVFRHRIVLI